MALNLVANGLFIAGFLLAIIAAIQVVGCAQQSSSPNPTASPPSAPATNPASNSASNSDLLDAKISDGENALTSRGYVSVKTENVTTYWRNKAGDCVRVVAADERYKVVEQVAASGCLVTVDTRPPMASDRDAP